MSWIGSETVCYSCYGRKIAKGHYDNCYELRIRPLAKGVDRAWDRKELEDSLNLDKCPFCGRLAAYLDELDKETYHGKYRITCCCCLASAGVAKSPEEAAANWNKRHE